MKELSQHRIKAAFAGRSKMRRGVDAVDYPICGSHRSGSMRGLLFWPLLFAVVQTSRAAELPAIINQSADGATVEVRADALDDLLEDTRLAKSVTTLNIRPYAKIRPNLHALGKLPVIETVSLAGVQIENDDLALLAKLTTLRSLDLSGTWITNQGIADHLSQCSKLQELNLSGTRISNACLPDLGQLVELRSLSLANTKIDSPSRRKALELESFAALDPLDNLKVLSLRHLRLVDVDLIELATLDSLTTLHLGDTIHDISIDGLFKLKEKSSSIRIGPLILHKLAGHRAVPDDQGSIVETGRLHVKSRSE